MPAALVALALGVVGGLQRLGAAPVDAPMVAVAWHGPLILFGFLGALVATERAVALRRPWSFASPGLGIAGTLLLVAGQPAWVVGMTWALAAVVAGAAVLGLERRHPSLANRCMVAGCAAWATGAALWGSGAQLPALLPWWAAFLVLMIVGERIQFGKLEYLRSTTRILVVLAGVLLTGAGLALVDGSIGMRVTGAAMLALAGWLVWVDVRRRARRPGLLWFVSVGLAGGYAWLGIAGLLWLVLAPVLAGGAHDAAVHALFQGFAMGMVLAHAPMIFPAVTSLRMPFHRGFHVHLALLHAGLALRVGADLAQAPELARTGSAITAAALALFVAVHATSAVRGALEDRADEIAGSARAGAGARRPGTARGRA